ncbi:MAG: hypothetical protein MAG794_01471 [Gammaproteobacteria bacterium]|nr:hypothetical protein [Gammaproteobacteria bacterium]
MPRWRRAGETEGGDCRLPGTVDLVYPVTDIVTFSGPESGEPQGLSRREWRALLNRHNAAEDRFPGRPKGAHLSRSGQVFGA